MPRIASAGLALLVAAAAITVSTVLWERVQEAKVPVPPGGPPTVRRLNKQQYLRSIAYIFGEDIEVPGRFDPPYRDEGLLAIGDAAVSLTASSLEQHELRAREIAAAVLEREVVLAALGKPSAVAGCALESIDGFEQDCAQQFIGKYGRLLYRRALTAAEVETALSMARAGSEQFGDLFQGLEVALSRLLISPYFLFRIEHSEPDPEREGEHRLDAYSLASRISFLLWDAPPDEQLLSVAESGTLHNDAVLASEVDRMLASPRFEPAVRAFFSDMLGYEAFDGLSKDQQIYPKFTPQLPADAREQSLRTIVDQLVEKQGDYRDLFTTRNTVVNRRLAALYQVPVFTESSEQWVEYTFSPDDNRAGLLTLAAFLMLDPSHEGQSSPTIRGKVLREQLLCHEVPDPPPDVNFDLVRDTDNPNFKTARDRLTVHSENPTCAGCHALTDPIGLGMENYDAIGAYRTHENGALIDASGTLDGKPFGNLIDMGQIVHDSSSTAECIAKRVYEYGIGRTVVAADRKWLDYQVERFAEKGFVYVDLMRDIATSQAFQAVSVSEHSQPVKTVSR